MVPKTDTFSNAFADRLDLGLHDGFLVIVAAIYWCCDLALGHGSCPSSG